jgi:DNA-binding protein HU-beta
MNKAEFVSMVAAKAGTSKKDSEANLNAILKTIEECLVKNVDVAFIGFGTFKAIKRPERMGRNPGTGQQIKIPATTAVQFKIGAKLKTAVAGVKKAAPAKAPAKKK